MKKSLALGIALLTLLSILPVATAGPKQEKVPVIIGFKEKPLPELIQQHGGETKHVYSYIPAIAASLSPQAIEALRKNPKIQYIEPDREYQYLAQELPWGVDRIDAEFAWSESRGLDVNVAFLDTGVDVDHPDLIGNIEGGYSVISGNNYDDKSGHGTFVAGIIAAFDNDIGVIGVGPEIDLWAVQISKAGIIKGSDIVAGIDWCIDTHYDDIEGNDIQVMSMSFGGYGVDPPVEHALQVAYDRGDTGIVLVAAAGNDGTKDPMYPAGYDTVIAVSATDKNDKVASWSNYGGWIELAAPGVNIYSTAMGGGYTTASGTSASCPHVSGTAALAIHLYPDHTNVQIRELLLSTADDLGEEGIDIYYGYGLVDAEEAAVGTESGDDLRKEPVHDVAVTAINAPSSVYQEDMVPVDVDVANEGTFEETFNVVLTDDTYEVTIDTKTVTLAAGASTTVSFSWDTTGATLGDHTLTATAGQVTDETDTADNSKSTTVTVEEKPSGNAKDMYVWDIGFSEKHYGRGGSKIDLMTTVTVKRDSNADGTSESTDEPVSNARVYMTLTWAGSESWNFAGDTDDNGKVTFTLKFAPKGDYEAKVTSVTHGTYTYNNTLDADNPDYYTIG